MLVDKLKIFVQAGKGGDGATSFRRAKYEPSGGPDGGDGGHGGDIIVKVSRGIRTLRIFRTRTRIRADDGADGAKNRRTGKSAAPEIIPVPAGTIVRDAETDRIIADLRQDGDEAIIAEGGRGGRGNANFASSTHRAPRHSEKGQPGQKRDVTLELKLLADVGMVGKPNAGKSSLLSRISSARPRVADYPFSTLEPMLGVVYLNEAHEGYVVADLPGLIEGAHLGKGLGVHFLKHVERSRLLLHLVDLTTSDPAGDFIAIREELEQYGAGLSGKPFVVAGTKVDLIADDKQGEFADKREQLADKREQLADKQGQLADDKVKQLLKASTEAGLFSQPMALVDPTQPEKGLFFVISSADGTGIDKLLKTLGKLLDYPDCIYPEPEIDRPEVFGEEMLPYRIKRITAEKWEVSGKIIEDLAAMTRFEERESVMRFHKRLDKIGMISDLAKLGAQSGDIVVIGEQELVYEPDSTDC